MDIALARPRLRATSAVMVGSSGGLRARARARARALGRHRRRPSPARSARSCRPTAPPSPTCAPPFRRRTRPRSGRLARGAWENLGRTGAEYAASRGRSSTTTTESRRGRAGSRSTGIEHFVALRDDGRPGLIFSAHLGNWELPAICAARYGLDATAVFRAPNDPAVARVVHEVRSETMGGPRGGPPGRGLRHAGRARAGRPSRHADRPAFHPRRDGRLHRPPGPDEPDPRQVRPPVRLPGPRRPGDPPAGPPLPPRADARRSTCRAIRTGRSTSQGAMQAMTARGRGLGARDTRSNGSGCTAAGGSPARRRKPQGKVSSRRAGIRVD